MKVFGIKKKNNKTKKLAIVPGAYLEFPR